MKDIFAQRIKYYRRKEDLTQEELANKIGISPQSVSKWERGEGFPDVSLLPIIANYFGISIDELLGNDKLSMHQDIMELHDKLGKVEKEEVVELAIEYLRKYPRNHYISRILIDYAMMLSDENREKYIPILKETCEKIIDASTNQLTRETAINCMCVICSDEELKKWYGMTGYSYKNTGMEIIEERLWKQGNREVSREYHFANDLNLLIHYMFRKCRSYDVPEKLQSWCISRIKMIELFSYGGEIPDLWLGAYAKLHAHLACAKFGLGENEEGYLCLEKSLYLLEKWLEIPYDNVFLLKTGSTEDIQIIMNRLRYRFSNGQEEYSENLFYLRVWREYIYQFMICQEYDTSKYEWYNGWEHFNSIRDEERFKQILERAKLLAVK